MVAGGGAVDAGVVATDDVESAVDGVELEVDGRVLEVDDVDDSLVEVELDDGATVVVGIDVVIDELP